tara:strand:- start:83 stop:445 length:363 start_codon:yes stop_codon:yes gene_type:complete
MKTNLTNLNKALIKNGGFSYSLSYGDLNKKPFYVVSVYGREKTYKNKPTNKDLKEFIYKNIDLLQKDNFCVGGWVDSGIYYYDVSELNEKKKTTLEQMYTKKEEHKQLAFFDLETLKEYK